MKTWKPILKKNKTRKTGWILKVSEKNAGETTEGSQKEGKKDLKFLKRCFYAHGSRSKGARSSKRCCGCTFPTSQGNWLWKSLGVDPCDSTNTFLSGARSWEFRTRTWSWDRNRVPFLGPKFPTGMPTSELSCLVPELGQGPCGLSREEQAGNFVPLENGSAWEGSRRSEFQNSKDKVQELRLGMEQRKTPQHHSLLPNSPNTAGKATLLGREFP